MKKIIHWMIAATVVGALAGCARTAPIEQVNAIVSAGHTEAQVRMPLSKQVLSANGLCLTRAWRHKR